MNTRITITTLLLCLFIGMTFAAVNVTATVGNEKPTVGQIQLCDGTCAITKSLDPATQFTVKATITDPNGQEDLNLSTLRLEFYTTADDNGGTADWDANTLSSVAHGTVYKQTQAVGLQSSWQARQTYMFVSMIILGFKTTTKQSKY
jgi:hypothetical protein